jgi:hypothetical protein
VSTLAGISPCGSPLVPGMLLCGFCYQAAQVLAGGIRCAACGRPAGDPGKDAVVVARVAPWPGAHFDLCSSCVLSWICATPSTWADAATRARDLRGR